MPKPNVDPVPMRCPHCECQGFVPVTRMDGRQGGDMGWKGTVWSRVVSCAGCGKLYGFSAPHPHREPEWQALVVGSGGVLVKRP